MQSMTGYGKGIAEIDGKTLVVEIKTVNHRYLDFSIKMPKAFLMFEDKIKKMVGSKISRGHIDVFVSYEKCSADTNDFSVDTDLAQKYFSAGEQISIATGAKNDMTASVLLKMSDVLTKKIAEDDEKVLCEMLETALDSALVALVQMRAIDGRAIYDDFGIKLANIADSLDLVKEFAPQVVTDAKQKMIDRIASLQGMDKIDDARLMSEIAIFADKCSIDEEITRLGAHIANMKDLIEVAEPQGRKMDFLVQEFNREANTIGSKANCLQITNEVLKIKNEIEKMREQAQNIE